MRTDESDPGVDRAAIHDWFSRAPGRLILDAETEQLNRVLPDLFGYYLLQVGHLCGRDMLSASRVLDRHIVDIDSQAMNLPYPSLRGAANALPVSSDSVDVVVLPHVLEFEARAHDAVREAHRILVPEGHLLISGFNPWSLMGVWRAALHRRVRVPWGGQFLALNRVKDWLALLGFDVLRVDNRFHRPPFSNERLLERLLVLERAGERAGGVMAGVYVLTARKRVLTLTPIKPRWSTRRRLVSVGLAKPTARVARIAGTGLADPGAETLPALPIRVRR